MVVFTYLRSLEKKGIIINIPGSSNGPPRLALTTSRREAGKTSQSIMYKVYILKSSDYPKTYVGITDNIDRRLKEHNSGKNFYTKRYKP